MDGEAADECVARLKMAEIRALVCVRLRRPDVQTGHVGRNCVLPQLVTLNGPWAPIASPAEIPGTAAGLLGPQAIPQKYLPVICRTGNN